MPRLFSYLKAWFSFKSNAMMDPVVQLRQQVDQITTWDKELREDAAQSLATRDEISDNLKRGIEQVSGYKAKALAAIQRRNGETDPVQKDKWAEAANSFAMELKAQEHEVETLKSLYETAKANADKALLAVKQNARKLREVTIRQRELLTTVEATKLQDKINKIDESMNHTASLSEAPSFKEIEDKINRNAALAHGRAELEATSLASTTRDLEDSMAQLGGADRLAELEAELDSGKPKQLTAKTSPVSGDA